MPLNTQVDLNNNEIAGESLFDMIEKTEPEVVEDEPTRELDLDNLPASTLDRPWTMDDFDLGKVRICLFFIV
jgi:hypothetical protein